MHESAFRKRFGARLKQEREGRGLTQRALAEEAGIAEKYLSRLELGMATPSLHVAFRLAVVLGGSLDQLLEIKRRPHAPELAALAKLLRGRSASERERALRVLAELLR